MSTLPNFTSYTFSPCESDHSSFTYSVPSLPTKNEDTTEHTTTTIQESLLPRPSNTHSSYVSN